MESLEITIPQEVYKTHLKDISGIKFTQREMEIISFLLSGRSSKRIALFFSISPKTVENHTRNIMGKLGCNSRESIIDFIEKSDRFSMVKKHYSSLLIYAEFERTLKTLASLKEKPSIVTINCQSQEITPPLLQYVEDHLRLLGIQVKTRFHKNLASFLSSKQTESSNTPSLSLLPDNHDIPPQLLDSDCFELCKYKNYYCLVFELLQKCLPQQKVEATRQSFQKKFESANTALVKRNLSHPFEEPQISRKKRFNLRWSLAVLFLGMAGLVGVYLFLFKDTPPGKKVAWVAPTLWNLSPQNPHFVGRKHLLKNIARTLQKNAAVVLTGGPGFGKTQTAKQYVYQAFQKYDIIWWFKVDSTLSTKIRTFAVALNGILKDPEKIQVEGVPFEKLLRDIKAVFRKRIFKCCLIFDEAEDFKTLKPTLPNPSPFIHLLITSRKKVMPLQTLIVDKLKQEESIIFIKQLLPNLKESQIMKLVSYLGGHPLALATAASFLALHPSIGAEQYLASHDLQKEESRAKVFVDQHERNLYATLKITLDALAKRHPEACKALLFLSLLHHNNVPFPYLVSFLKHMGLKITADEVLSILYERSLLEVEKSDKPENIRLSMHQLVRDLINDQIPEAEKKQLLEKAIQVMAESFGGRGDIFINRIVEAPEYLMQAQALSAEAQKMNYASIPLFSLRIRMLTTIMDGLRDFETGRKFLSIIQEDQAKFKIQSLPLVDQALLEDNFGYLELRAPNLEKALEHYKCALEIRKKIPQADNRDLMMSITAIAQVYSDRGELQKAEQMVEEGKKLLPLSQSDLANEFFLTCGWAKFLLIKGDFEGALKIVEHALQLKKKNPKFLAFGIPDLHCKAEILAKMGRYNESLQLLDQVEQEIQKFYGERTKTSHAALSMVLRAFNTLGDTSKTTESITLVENALEIYEHVFRGKKKHRRQGFAYFVCAKLYEQQGDNQKAIQTYLESEAVYNAVLKEKGVDSVSRLWSAMALLSLKSKDMTLAQSYLQRHINTFGRNHPRTLEIVEYADKNGIPVSY